LMLADLPELTKIAVKDQPPDITLTSQGLGHSNSLIAASRVDPAGNPDNRDPYETGHNAQQDGWA
jgi:hypothetical protein